MVGSVGIDERGEITHPMPGAPTMYIGHISALKRDLMKRKIKKLQRAGDWG